jgi:hypothetical protein
LIVRGSLFVGRRVFGFGSFDLGLLPVRPAQKTFFAVFREKDENNSCNSYQSQGLSVSRTRAKAVKKG